MNIWLHPIHYINIRVHILIEITAAVACYWTLLIYKGQRCRDNGQNKIEWVDQNGRMPASYGWRMIHSNIDTCTFVEGSISQENNASRNFCKIISLNLDNYMIFWLLLFP